MALFQKMAWSENNSGLSDGFAHAKRLPAPPPCANLLPLFDVHSSFIFQRPYEENPFG
jgi:hypothetical protein